MEIRSQGVTPSPVVDSRLAGAAAVNTRDATVSHTPAANAEQQMSADVGAVPNTAQTRKAVEDTNKTIQQLASNLEFSVDEDTKITVVRLVDRESKEVIRQFPPEEMLEIAKRLDEFQGLLLKSKA